MNAIASENERVEGAEQEKVTDKLISRYSAITAAMELLPDKMASVGILPLQTRLIYLIGKQYGFSLDSRHMLEFAAVFGIGAVAQRAESVIRKVIHADGAAGVAAASASTFAITYALGKVAEYYYSHGRKFELAQLKQAFTQFRDQAGKVYELSKREVEELCRTGNPASAAGE